MPEYTDTRSYAAFKDGYNAGVARDEQSKDRILSRANQGLYEDCKKYSTISSKDINYFAPPTVKAESTENLFILYKNDVEFTNSFQEQVLQDERNYFEKKYSKSVYRYLLEQRTKYNADKDLIIETDVSKCPTTTNPGTSGGNNGNSCKSEQEKCTNTVNSLFQKLSKFYPSISAETTFRKIEYRDAEHELLMTISHFINIIYYVLLFIMIILLASSNRLLIKERFLIYFLLVLLPFLYPYLFNIGKKIFNSLFISKPIHGPKNAFVEIPPPNIDGFNN